MHIKDQKTDIKAGAEIFNSIPIWLRPCWASLILQEFDSYNSSVPDQVFELYEIIDNENNWNEAHNQFDKIRRYALSNKNYQPFSYLHLAELIAKVTYNSVIGQVAPFDSDSGYYIPSLTVTTADYYGGRPLLDETTNLFWLLSRFRNLKSEIKSANNFKTLCRIDKLLWKKWDPIGINHIAPRDEYQSYTPAIFKLKTSGADSDTIAKTLHKIETETMGVLRDIDHCRQVADKIVKLK